MDNQLIGLADHMVTLEVDGVNIGEVTTEADGRFAYTWVVPDIFTFGDHVMIADADARVGTVQAPAMRVSTSATARPSAWPLTVTMR